MSLDNYRNYITIIEEGSLSAASKKIRIAQPALSNQMKALEDKFGAQLVKMRRGVRRLKVTEAGRILYEKAKYLCELEDTASREIRDLEGGFSGTLRIGLSPSASEQVVRQLLTDFHRIWSNVRYELHEVSIGDIGEMLLSGICELGIVRASPQTPELFTTYPMDNEMLAAVYLKDSNWLTGVTNPLTISELKGIPLCVTRGWLNTIEKAFTEMKLLPELLCISTTRLSSLIWASEGEGVALIPVDSFDSFSDNLTCLPVSGKNMQIQKSIITVKNRYLSAVAKNFLLYCNERLQRNWTIN